MPILTFDAIRYQVIQSGVEIQNSYELTGNYEIEESTEDAKVLKMGLSQEESNNFDTYLFGVVTGISRTLILLSCLYTSSQLVTCLGSHGLTTVKISELNFENKPEVITNTKQRILRPPLEISRRVLTRGTLSFELIPTQETIDQFKG